MRLRELKKLNNEKINSVNITKI